MAITLLLSLFACSRSAAQETSLLSDPTREVLHSTLFGVGSSNVLDSYLSPYNYKGVDFRIQRETMRMTRLAGGRVANQSLIDFDVAINQNRPGNRDEFAGGIRYGQAWYYHLTDGYVVNPLADTSRSPFQLAAGLGASAYLGGIYIDRGGNNPAQAKADVMVDAGLLATYRFRIARHNYLVRYQLNIPLIGAAFSPNYGQSYYEAFGSGHYDHNVVFAYPGNMPSMRHRLLVDIPIRRHTLRLGYTMNIQQSTFNELKYHSYSHCFMIGFNKYFFRR